MPRPARKRATAKRDSMSVVLDEVRRLDRGLRLAARRVERETGLSAAQLYVLEQLSRSTPRSLNELADLTRTDRSSVSGVVDKLLDAGLVKRAIAANDRRRAEVRLAARGARTLARAPLPPTALLLRALAKMPPARLRRLALDLGDLTSRLGFAASPMLFED
jgi:DNA-binding MarR family transcriptional regulator